MKTDGLNLGLSLRGTTDVSAAKAKIPKKEQELAETSSRGPDSFSGVLGAKSAPPQQAPPPQQQSQQQASRKENISAPSPETENGPRRTDPDDNAPSVKEKTFEKVEKTKAKKAPSEREKAMLDFMDSMESELGIPPAMLVEAMAKLPEQKILQTPEESASQVIDSLNLPPEQAERAYSKYMGFLGQVAQMPPPTNPSAMLATSALKDGSAVQVKELSTREKRELLNDSLDRLNQKFFMQQGHRSSETAEKVMDAKNPQGMDFEEKGFEMAPVLEKNQAFENPQILRRDPQLGNPQLHPSMNPLGTPPPENGKAQSKEFFEKSAAGYSKPVPVQANQAQQADSMQGLMAKLSALGASASALGKSVQKTPNGSLVADSANDAGNANAMASNMRLDSGLGISGASMAKANQGDGSEKGFDDSSDESGFKKSDALNPQARMDGMGQTGKQMGFKETLHATPGMAATSRGEVNPNIEKIMGQAQIIAKKGGGEATMRFNQEGLGDIHMKITVKDGRVNVEMATETKEAKKLLEGSLADLKTSLGAHKLAVESVKVDVGLQNSNDHHQQKGQDLMKQHDQSKDQARQFFQDFREENLNRREPFFEMPGIKAYSRPSTGPSPLGPSPEEATRSRATVSGRGERMNLVA